MHSSNSTLLPEVSVPDAEVSEDVLTFCRAHGIVAELKKAMDLAQDVYRPARRMTATKIVDPESGDEWVVVDVPVHGGVDDVLRRKREMTQRWVAGAKPEALGRISICYDII